MTTTLAQVPAAPEPILERLLALHPKLIDLTLDRLERLLSLLGNPERSLPPIVHVAGTNAKGSTVAYLRAMHAAAGRRVHVYTSPHLVRFNERIVLAGETVDDSRLAAALDECERVNAGTPITFFEITTAAAFLLFAREPADLLLLEVGLGGRLDATNVIDRPLLSVITPVDYDHRGFLGDTLTAIAGEKAGILKPGVPAVIGRQQPEGAAAIKARAAAIGAPLHRLGREWDVAPDGETALRFRFGAEESRWPRPNLAGDHQIDNAGIALAAAVLIGGALALGAPDMRAGLTGARWPARLQHLTTGPLVEMLPSGWDLWLDGGHNAHAAAALARVMAGWRREQPGRAVHLIYGTLDNRDPKELGAAFVGLADEVRTVPIPGDHATLAPADAAARLREIGLTAAPAQGVAAALADLTKKNAPEGRVLICGSLYLAGSVLGENG